MVLLTMTSAAVRAIEKARTISEESFEKLQLPSEPPLAEAEVGNPISHGQLISISKLIKAHYKDEKKSEGDDEKERPSYHLNDLLKGARIYIPPPPPKKEPTPEYKALMSRLRAEEEARAYSRMLHPPPAMETFEQRFHASPLARLNPTATDFGEQDVDEITYADVHRQIILIINILVSIVACSVFIWIAARHWSVPKRLGLSMSGSGLIAIAEVVIYSGYVRRVKEAKVKEKKKPEIKEIIDTWVIDSSARPTEKRTAAAGSSTAPNNAEDDGFRYRKGKHR